MRQRKFAVYPYKNILQIFSLCVKCKKIYKQIYYKDYFIDKLLIRQEAQKNVK